MLSLARSRNVKGGQPQLFGSMRTGPLEMAIRDVNMLATTTRTMWTTARVSRGMLRDVLPGIPRQAQVICRRRHRKPILLYPTRKSICVWWWSASRGSGVDLRSISH